VTDKERIQQINAQFFRGWGAPSKEVRWLFSFIEEQAAKVDRYEKALKEIEIEVNNSYYLGSYEILKITRKALEASE
jgi:hypothetical protein